MIARGPARFTPDEARQLVGVAVRNALAADAAERRKAAWSWNAETLQLAAALNDRIVRDRTERAA